ncbi:hypothetical protein HanIR_Chr05g0210091 [Helianthus annuus]|nr:hypothetical protein HanIR_Chr05g0210091 [Helianthus annuus]
MWQLMMYLLSQNVAARNTLTRKNNFKDIVLFSNISYTKLTRVQLFRIQIQLNQLKLEKVHK